MEGVGIIQLLLMSKAENISLVPKLVSRYGESNKLVDVGLRLALTLIYYINCLRVVLDYTAKLDTNVFLLFGGGVSAPTFFFQLNETKEVKNRRNDIHDTAC